MKIIFKTFRIIFGIAIDIINIPATVFHELCHIAMLILFFPFIKKIYYREIEISTWLTRERRIGYKIDISFQCRYDIITMLITAAPMIGWGAGLIYFSATSNVWMYAYFWTGMFSGSTFRMSDMDVKHFKIAWYRLIKNKVTTK